jgi:DNA polymerase V
MRAKTCFALVDCNNFYASCERVFKPQLNHQPVIVLSSNDGCVVARSNEAKSLNIQMGQPYFQIESLCKKHNVHVFSSNFALYGDISRRVMMTLQLFCPDMEIYSIDEAFLKLDKIAVDPLQLAEKIKKTIWQHIGIPVSIGIAPTKTLAKVASHLAKQNPTMGIYDLRSPKVTEIILTHFPVEKLWGVGKNFSVRLHYRKIHTAGQLCALPSPYLKKEFGVMMTRVVMELQGTSCIPLEEAQSKKNIICSRSFGKKVTQLSDLIEAASSYCATACKKARSQRMKAQMVGVYLRTNSFNKTSPFYSASDQQTLIIPSNDTVLITHIVASLLKKLFKPDYQYQKVGVVLLDLLPEKIQQSDLFEKNTNTDNQALMNVMDCINQKWGQQTLFLASEGIQKTWSVKSIRRSPRYTTCWSELPCV